MKILYGDIDVTKYLISYTKKADYIEGLLLGQTPSYELELKVKNTDGIFGKLTDKFTVYEGEKQTGIFTVYEKPQKYTKIITLVLYDNMLLLNPRYTSKLNYKSGTVTINDQLNEIASLTGLLIDYSNLPTHVLSRKVKSCDTTISMRNYVGWIAETGGCNVEINSNGGVIFKEINTSHDFEINHVGDFENEEEWELSKVCFNNGVKVYEAGDNSGNTLFISENNPYCNAQPIIDYIYNKYSGLKLMSVSKCKMRGNRDMRLGDIIKYKDINFMLLSLNCVEYGGESYPVYEAIGKLATKNEELTENRVDTTVKVNNLQEEMNTKASTGARNGYSADEIWTGNDIAPTFTIPNVFDYKYFLVEAGSSTSSEETAWIIVPFTDIAKYHVFRGIGGRETESEVYGAEIYTIRGTVSISGDDAIVEIGTCFARLTYILTTNPDSVRLYIKRIVGVK